MTDLWSAVAEVWWLLASSLSLVGDVLSRDPAIGAVVASGRVAAPALGVTLLAIASTGLGHVYVLFLNRVRGLRMVLFATVSLLWSVLLRVLEALITWGVATLVTGRQMPIAVIVTVFLLALAPQVFNVLMFLPHFGRGIGRILQAWSFLVLMLLLDFVYDVPPWQAMLFAASGWTVMQVVSHLLSRPLGWLGTKAWTLLTGRPILVTSRDILAGTPFIPVEADRPDDGGR